MTVRGASPWIRGVLVTTAVLMLGLMGLRWLPLAAGSGTAGAPTREIVMVARNMAFYIDGDPTPNPALRLRAGEKVRLVLRNADPGVTHNFAVAEWGLATRDLHGEGTGQLEFLVPDVPGPREYQCTPHAAMMRGTIDVR
jgi:plastocyanin